jgi:hypothetical protein
MSSFNEYCHKGVCEVCGKETEVVVVASTMGAMINAICEECLNKQLEPYGNMVAYISLAGNYPKDFDDKYIERIRYMLGELGKTEEEFIHEIEESDREYREWCESQSNQEEVCIIDEVGGHHEAGLGWNPNDVFCGECSNITCKGCVNEKHTE